MENAYMNAAAEQSKLKVSISARLIAAFAYLIPAIGGALSSLYLMDVMRALRNAESAGIGAVMAGLTESTVPALASLYLAAFCGFIVIIVLIIRMIMQTKTASPASWFFVLCGFFLLVPAGLFFEAESMIIEVLTAPVDSIGIAGVASNVSLFLILSVASALFVFVILLVMSVIPFSTSSKPRWSPLITAILIEILIIIAAVAFQLRFLWLYNAALQG
jgi:hypothetical protein